jgi:DHA3 family tetracycline resistance protein-like MFS transporter
MFAKNSKAYSVYLLFRFVCSLAVSMSTVLSIVYHLEVVQLDAFQLVLVGTVQETSCFLFEMHQILKVYNGSSRSKSLPIKQ